MRKPLSIRQSFIFILLISFAGALAPVRAGAQAVPLREKKAGLSTFFTYMRLSPDYGPQINNGVMFGSDYSWYARWFIPAVEFRVKRSTGATTDEKTYGGGVRVERPFGTRWHPFGNFLISAGTIDFHFRTPPVKPDGTAYTSDTSTVYTFGGGLDWDITPNWSARGEFQSERWSLGNQSRHPMPTPGPIGPVSLTPSMWGMGVVYRIPFKPRVSR
jgi:opacity protein-like surface antigen